MCVKDARGSIKPPLRPLFVDGITLESHLGRCLSATDQIDFGRSYRPGFRGHAYGLIVVCQGVNLLIYVTRK